MLLSGREGIVVEVVDDDSGAVIGEVNVELEEKGADGTGGGRFSGEGEKNVAILVHEIDDVLRSQRGTKTCIIQSINLLPHQLGHYSSPLDLGGRIRRWS